MAELSIPEEECGEPALNYWKPVPKPPPVVLSSLAQTCLGGNNDNMNWSYQEQLHGQPPLLPPTYVYQQQSPYPIADVVHSYIQNQQIGLCPGGPIIEGERRRLPQCSYISRDHVLYSMSANSNIEQDSQSMTDSMIQDEVTRAAKTLFSKRNRTLLHWLNPDINKNQIKIDVNAAWENLPPAEKMFYISQVLGRFAPHVTSLMVNPKLEPSSLESLSAKTSFIENDFEKSTVNESPSSGTKVRQRSRKTQAKNKSEKQIKTEIKTEDDESCDSGLVVDVGDTEKLKEISPVEEKPRVKRKYTKRKRKDGATEQNSTNSCPPDIKNIKQEPNTDLPVAIKDIKIEPDSEISSDFKKIKEEPNNKVDKNLSNSLPRPKRKYVKRKLVRKKYKKREPKKKPPLSNEILAKEIKQEVKSEPEPLHNEGEEMEMDLWIELGNDSILTNEEVDNFFDSIEDPDSLFRELGIIEN